LCTRYTLKQERHHLNVELEVHAACDIAQSDIISVHRLRREKGYVDSLTLPVLPSINTACVMRSVLSSDERGVCYLLTEQKTLLLDQGVRLWVSTTLFRLQNTVYSRKYHRILCMVVLLISGQCRAASCGRGKEPLGAIEHDLAGFCGCGFPQSLKLNAGMVPRLGHHSFLPNLFQFIIFSVVVLFDCM
jgi:hypothetical protein